MSGRNQVILGHKAKKISGAEVRPSWEMHQSSTIICWSQTPQPFHIDSEQPIVPTVPDNHVHHKAPLIWYIFLSWHLSWTAFQNTLAYGARDWAIIRHRFSKPPLWPFVPGISWPTGIIRNIFCLCFLSPDFGLCSLHTSRMIQHLQN